MTLTKMYEEYKKGDYKYLNKLVDYYFIPYYEKAKK